MRSAVRLAVSLVLIGIGLGFAGGLHPAGDSISIVRLQLTVVLVCLLPVLWFIQRSHALVVGAVALLSAGTMVQLPPTEAVDTLSVYQKNLNYRLKNMDLVEADIRELQPDIVTLQEVSLRLRPMLSNLADTYPNHAYCPFHTVIGGVAVVSKWQINQVICIEGAGFVAAEIARGSQSFWAVSIHLHWPWPYRQSEQLDRIIQQLENLDGPVLVGGDFNMVPWGNAVRRIRKATGTQLAQAPFSTFPRFHPFAPLAIDHVLGPHGGISTARQLDGSDHKGVFARLSF